MASEKPRKLIIFIWIAVVLINIASGYKVVRAIYWGEKSEKWPTTTGTVIESEIRKYHRGSSAHIKYNYSINGTEYSANRVAFYDRNFSSWAEKYPMGRKVTVYYDPDFPERSVLEPGGSIGTALSGEFIMVLIGSAVLLFFLITGYGIKWDFPLK